MADQNNKAVYRECNACPWRGPDEETVMLGGVGPLCPECRETTEVMALAAAPAVPTVDALTRYDPELISRQWDQYEVGMESSPVGDYVKFADVQALLATPSTAPLVAAKQQPQPSCDAALRAAPAGQHEITRLDILSLIREQCHRYYASAIDREEIDAKYMAEIDAALRSLEARAKPQYGPHAWKSLGDVQWLNIVNHDRAFHSMSKDEAVQLAVKMAEAKLRALNEAHPADPEQAKLDSLAQAGLAAALENGLLQLTCEQLKARLAQADEAVAAYQQREYERLEVARQPQAAPEAPTNYETTVIGIANNVVPEVGKNVSGNGVLTFARALFAEYCKCPAAWRVSFDGGKAWTIYEWDPHGKVEGHAVIRPLVEVGFTSPVAAPEAPASAHCSHCDDTGDVHRADGEWMGRCSCPYGASPAATTASASGEKCLDCQGDGFHVVEVLTASGVQETGGQCTTCDGTGSAHTPTGEYRGPCPCLAAPEATSEQMGCTQVATFDFHAHLARQAEFSENTFGPGMRTAGVCDHIRKELREIEADPSDLREWIDVVILALDGAWRCGGSPEQIIAGIVAKQTKNEGRNWPDWRTADPNKAIEHDRTGEVAAPKIAVAPTNTVIRPASDPTQQAYREDLVARLTKYEGKFNHYIDRGEAEGPSHHRALIDAALTPEGLMRARVYAGKYPTEQPGFVTDYYGPVRGVSGAIVEPAIPAAATIAALLPAEQAAPKLPPDDQDRIAPRA